MKSTRKDLANVIATHKGADAKLLAREIAAFLIESRQTASLESLLRDVMAYREANGQVEAEVTAAHDLSDAVLAEVRQLVQSQKPGAKKVSVFPVHDQAVIGGIKVRLANEQLDLTVRAQLDTFKRLTTEGANAL